MTWTITIWTNGSRVKVDTGLWDYNDAIAYVERLYGDDYSIVSQETTGAETQKGGLLGLGGWL